MKLQIDIDSDLMNTVIKFLKTKNKSIVANTALKVLIEKISQEELARMGGKIKSFKKILR